MSSQEAPSTDVEYLLSQLTSEEKVWLLSGSDNWHTHSIARLGIGAIKVNIYNFPCLLAIWLCGLSMPSYLSSEGC